MSGLSGPSGESFSKSSLMDKKLENIFIYNLTNLTNLVIGDICRVCRVLHRDLWIKIWKIYLERALTTLTNVLCHEVCQCSQFPMCISPHVLTFIMKGG
jgi:hypothetical protein